MKVIVKNNEPRVHNIGEKITLWPGANMVDQAEWEKAKEIRLIQWHLKQGNLEEEKSIKPFDDDTVPTKAMKPPDAVKLIRNTFNVLMLRAWRDEDGRGVIQRAIAEQIDRINSMEIKKKGDGDGNPVE